MRIAGFVQGGVLSVLLSSLGCVPTPSSLGPVIRPPEASAVPIIGQPPVIRDFSTESQNERNARMQWWRDAAFGMFVHWGPYAVPAGKYQGKVYAQPGEWLQAWANIPRNEYEMYALQFTASKYDPTEWVRAAKQAGMKYLVVTSKHHDGFCIFDSTVTDFDMVDRSPYGKDALAPLAAECKRQGISFGIYYSILDWHHPSQFPNPAGKDATNGHNKTKLVEGQKEAYVAYMKVQLAELIQRYDPEVLWFDGAWTDWWTEPDGKDLYNYIRSIKPSLLVNNRIGKGRGAAGLTLEGNYVGDFGTPEQKVPPTGLPDVDWESCITMNETWGYKTSDDKWKSSKDLVQTLVDIASKRGNYLLNVGPTAEGEIPGPSIDRLKDIGDWMSTNGDAIYATGASPFTEQLPWGRATVKLEASSDGEGGRTRLFLHVFQWPTDGKLVIPRLNNTIRSAYLLADRDRKPLPHASTTQEWTLNGPRVAPDPRATVIVLELDGAPRRLMQVRRRHGSAPVRGGLTAR